MKKRQHPVSAPIDRGFYIAGWVLIAVTGIYLLFSHITGFQLSRHMTPCAFHLVTGLYCPGCGGTRATVFLMHGHPLQSLLYHPFVIYCALLGGYFMLSQTIMRICRKDLPFVLHYHDWMLWLTLIIVIVNFILKNLALIVWHIDLLPLVP